MNKGIFGLVGCLGVLVIVALILLLPLIGLYNGLVQSSAGVDTAWAQVQTQYQRRADLIPNLVRTVEGAANFERSTLTDVVNARANATKVTRRGEALRILRNRHFVQTARFIAKTGSHG